MVDIKTITKDYIKKVQATAETMSRGKLKEVINELEKGQYDDEYSWADFRIIKSLFEKEYDKRK